MLTFTVPAGSPSSRCNGPDCDARVFWVVTNPKPPKKARRMLVDCSVPGGREPTATEPGEGVSHFATCPNADQFRRRK